jgi:hypothetical protein
MRRPLYLVAVPLLACGGARSGKPEDDAAVEGDAGAVAEYDDGRSGDPGDAPSPYFACASGDAPYASLTEAIAAAPDGSIVDACPGIYAETLELDARRLIIRGQPGQVIVDAGATGSVVAVTGGADVTLRGLILRGGMAVRGGGIRCVDATLTVDQTAVDGNVASEGGGGLHAVRCTLRVSDSTISANRGKDGGGIHLQAGETTIARSTVVGNSAEWIGGGLYQLNGALTIDDSRFSENLSTNDGAGMPRSSSTAPPRCGATTPPGRQRSPA